MTMPWNLVGFRTVVLNASIVGMTATLQYLVGYDWVAAVGEVWAMLIVSGLNVVMRWFTATPIFKTK